MKAAYYSFCRAISEAFFTKIAFNNPKDLLKFIQYGALYLAVIVLLKNYYVDNIPICYLLYPTGSWQNSLKPVWNHCLIFHIRQ